MDKQKARIKNWRVVDIGGIFWLEGDIYGHPNTSRVSEGGMAHTSKLLSIDFEHGIAVTLNTIYTLE